MRLCPRVAGRVASSTHCVRFLQAAIESMSVGRFFILPFFGLVSSQIVANNECCVKLASL